MKNMIFGLVALICAWSGFAAEEVNKSLPETEQQPLKFRVNQETGAIEDAPGSHLIKEFLSAVSDVDAKLGSLRQGIEEEMKELDGALAKMPQGSIERFGTEIHRKKLVQKLDKLAKERERFFNYEAFLQEILKTIQGTALSSTHCIGYWTVPDYEVLTSQPFKDLKLDFFNVRGIKPEENAGKSSLLLKINNLPSAEVDCKIHVYLRSHKIVFKLQDIQKEVFKRGALIYSVATHRTAQLDPEQRLILNSVSSMAEYENRNVLEILKEQIDKSILKAENIVIPKLAPGYRMAKVIMAFQEEAPRHRPQKAEVPATGGSS